LPLRLGLEPIPDAEARLDERVNRRAAVDLVPELPDEDVDGAVAIRVAAAPEPLQQLVASDDATALERERLYDVITRHALAWAVASASPVEIDRINIHRASLDAMRQAIAMLEPLPDMVVVDAFKIPDLMMAQVGVPKGDRKVSAVAAASIVAKVTRDREMRRHHEADPRYGYDRHKGYATAEHLAAVALHGYSSLHRRTFKPATLFDTME